MKKSFTSSINLDQCSQSDLKKKFGSGTPKYSFGRDTKVKESFVDYMSTSRSKNLKKLPGPANYEPNNINLNRNHSQWR